MPAAAAPARIGDMTPPMQQGMANVALFSALRSGQIEAVRSAIARGANVNARDDRGRQLLGLLSRFLRRHVEHGLHLFVDEHPLIHPLGDGDTVFPQCWRGRLATAPALQNYFALPARGQGWGSCAQSFDCGRICADQPAASDDHPPNALGANTKVRRCAQ